MKFSLIVSTLGRFDEVVEFVASLNEIGHRDFELVIVDQNEDDRLRTACEGVIRGFPFIYVNTSHERGLSRGRNVGIALASGDILCFPDDDCIYPPNLLTDVIGLFDSTGADVICGRAAASDGRSINGRFEKKAQVVSRRNVFTTQIEWVVFFKRSVISALAGYDVDIGVGASSPWQACEGPDITLRALDSGFRVYYDPAIYAFHPELLGDARARKVRGYARGMGHVFKKHRYRFWQVAHYFIRPVGGIFLAVARFDLEKASLYVQVTIGRIEGFSGNCIDR